MTKDKLGTLKKVDLREVWESENSDFTPWLAQEENIEILGEKIGLDLEVEAQEKNVGKFRADILCKNIQVFSCISPLVFFIFYFIDYDTPNMFPYNYEENNHI